MVRNDKGSRKICRWIRCILKEQKLYRSPSRKADTKYNPRKTMETHQYRLYYQVTTGPRIRYDTSSMRPIYKNGPFYRYHRKNISRRIRKAVPRPSIVALWTFMKYCIR